MCQGTIRSSRSAHFVCAPRIFFSSLAQGLAAASSSSTHSSPELWAGALQHALERLFTYTRARPPSRTLVDPLSAFVRALAASPEDFSAAAGDAGRAAEATRDLQAKAGRSAYIESEHLRTQKVPDPGAWGVKVILEGILQG